MLPMFIPYYRDSDDPRGSPTNQLTAPLPSRAKIHPHYNLKVFTIQCERIAFPPSFLEVQIKTVTASKQVIQKYFSKKLATTVHLSKNALFNPKYTKKNLKNLQWIDDTKILSFQQQDHQLKALLGRAAIHSPKYPSLNYYQTQKSSYVKAWKKLLYRSKTIEQLSLDVSHAFVFPKTIKKLRNLQSIKLTIHEQQSFSNYYRHLKWHNLENFSLSYKAKLNVYRFADTSMLEQIFQLCHNIISNNHLTSFQLDLTGSLEIDDRLWPISLFELIKTADIPYWDIRVPIRLSVPFALHRGNIILLNSATPNEFEIPSDVDVLAIHQIKFHGHQTDERYIKNTIEMNKEYRKILVLAVDFFNDQEYDVTWLVKKCTSLKRLSFEQSRFRFNLESMQDMQSLTRLRSLTMSDRHHERLSFMYKKPLALGKLFENVGNLDHFSYEGHVDSVVHRIWKSSSSFESRPQVLCDMKRLRSIELSLCMNHYEEIIQSLSLMSQLESMKVCIVDDSPLNIDGRAVSFREFEGLKNLKTLRFVLRATLITESFEQFLSTVLKLKKLESVYIQGTTYLEVDWKVLEQSVELMQDLENLKEMELKVDFLRYLPPKITWTEIIKSIGRWLVGKKNDPGHGLEEAAKKLWKSNSHLRSIYIEQKKIQ